MAWSDGRRRGKDDVDDERERGGWEYIMTSMMWLQGICLGASDDHSRYSVGVELRRWTKKVVLGTLMRYDNGGVMLRLSMVGWCQCEVEIDHRGWRA